MWLVTGHLSVRPALLACQGVKGAAESAGVVSLTMHWGKHSSACRFVHVDDAMCRR